MQRVRDGWIGFGVHLRPALHIDVIDQWVRHLAYPTRTTRRFRIRIPFWNQYGKYLSAGGGRPAAGADLGPRFRVAPDRAGRNRRTGPDGSGPSHIASHQQAERLQSSAADHQAIRSRRDRDGVATPNERRAWSSI